MIYLIFTQDGFEDAKQTILENKATLWVNDAFLTTEQHTTLTNAKINVNVFTKPVVPNDEKSIMAAIKIIETDNSDTELFVEYL